MFRIFFNAAFSEGMVDDGYEDVVNIDISSVVIDTMIKKYSDRPQLKCTFFFFLFSSKHLLILLLDVAIWGETYLCLP